MKDLIEGLFLLCILNLNKLHKVHKLYNLHNLCTLCVDNKLYKLYNINKKRVIKPVFQGLTLALKPSKINNN